jgi:peptidoglycan/LPS O-acetylase OafA/YrhL
VALSRAVITQILFPHIASSVRNVQRIESSNLGGTVKEHYEPFLDGVRGVMAMWVFVYHAADLCGFSTHLIPPGAIAVDVFMFLSGLLMTRNFIARKEAEPLGSAKTILKFFIRRFFRIAPLYYPLLLVAFVFWAQYVQLGQEARAAFPPPWASLLGNNPSQPVPTFANVLTHVSFLFGFLPQYAANNALPDWSLALEMQFYAAIPFILLLARRVGLTVVTLVFMVVQFLMHRYVGLYLTPEVLGLWPQPTLLAFKINCFMAGVLMAAYFEYRSLTLLVLMFVTAFFNQHLLFSGSVLFCFLAMSDTRQTALERMIGFGKKILSGPTGRFFGDISYAVYLMHSLILIPLLALLLKFDAYQNVRPVVRFGILFGLAVMIVIPCAFALHRGIEMPGIELGRRLASRVTGPRTRPVASP